MWFKNGNQFSDRALRRRGVASGNEESAGYMSMEKRHLLARAECARRIVQVADITAQLNMSADAASGVLSTEKAAIYQEGVLWIKECRQTWPRLADSSADIYADENWPTPSAAVIALAAEY